MKEISLPVVMQFISDFVTADKIDLQQLNVEERTVTLAEILSKPVSSLSESEIKRLCRAVKEFCSSNKNFRIFQKFPDLLTFDDLANYCANTKNINVKVSRDRLIRFWKKETGANMRKLLPSSIESKEITRCQAIYICEMCEEITGRQILANSRTPMQYLGEEITYNDIIDFFTNGSRKINAIHRKVFKTTPENIQKNLKTFRLKVLKVYAMNCGQKNLSDADIETFEKKRVYDCKNPHFKGENDWDLPVWWTEEQLDVHLSANLGWVKPETTVKNIVDAFVDAKVENDFYPPLISKSKRTILQKK